MSRSSASTEATLDVAKIRAQFPILDQKIGGHPLVYLDNAASCQKPQVVIDAVRHNYERDYANIHRGVHELSMRSTQAYEDTRNTVRAFLNAGSAKEIIFVRGTTEAVNLVAQTHVRSTIEAGDEIVITGLEHHSNIVPWQMLCEQTGAVLRVAPVLDDGSVDIDAFEALLGKRTRFAAFLHVSNALGTILPVKRMVAAAKACGATTLVDGAQAVPHTAVDVRDLDCDFYCFSAHKVYGPSGIGALYGKAELLEAMPPYQGGGDMIKSVSFEGTTYNDVPHKFEAGTPNIAGTIGMGAALKWVGEVGIDRIAAWEDQLVAECTARLSEIPGVRLVGTAPEKAAVVSFVMDAAHPHDIGTVLDQQGVAIRAGHHCAQPVMERFGVAATARASFAAFNTLDDVAALAAAVQKVQEIFG